MARQLPHNLDAERFVLGNLLLRGAAAYAEVAPILEGGECFFHPMHAVVYAEIAACVAANQPVDLVVLAARMEQSGSLKKLASAGGGAFLAELALQAGANGKHYAAIIREAALARSLIVMCSELMEKGYGGLGGSELVQEAQRRVFELGAGTAAEAEPEPFRQVLHDAICQLEQRYNHKSAITGIPSGLDALDMLTQGWQPGELIVVCGRPGSGKSAFAGQSAIHAAEIRTPTLCFHLEMSRQQVGARALSAEARVDGRAVRTGLMETADWIRVMKHASRLADVPLWLDTATQTLAGLSSKAVRWRATACGAADAPALVVVDFLQLIMAAKAAGKNRDQEVGELSRGLKALAKQLRCPVLAVASLSRECEKRADKRPIPSDLRDSGSIESDADVIIGLYREAMYSADADPEEAEIIVSKNRNGATGTVSARWLGTFTRFEPMPASRP